MANRAADRYFELKSQIHRKLIGVLNLERVSSIPKDRVRAEIGRVVERLLDEERVPMTTAEQTKIIEEVLDEVLGLGPLETAAQRASPSRDILVNRYDKVFIERNGKLSETPVRFKDDAHLLHIIEKIVSQVGRRIDEAQPIVDARLQDGSRVNAIIPPLALDGPCLSIRRFGRHVITQDEMLQYKTLTPGMLRFLSACVQCEDDGPDLGRNRLRQDDHAERALALHPRGRAHHHHRGHGRIAAAAAPRGEVRNPAAEPEQGGRHQPAACCCAPRSVCGPTASSSASAAAPKRSTCCRR